MLGITQEKHWSHSVNQMPAGNLWGRQLGKLLIIQAWPTN
jgi:hypothetical protein